MSLLVRPFKKNSREYIEEMSDKQKKLAVPAAKNVRSARLSTIGAVASTSKSRILPTTTNEKNASTRSKMNETVANATLLGDGDSTMVKRESSMSDLGTEQRKILYGNFLRAMLEECIVDDKIEREETQIDIQMALLADRFQKTVDQLDKTNRRLKDINFVVEQKRLLDLKNNDCTQYYEMMDNSNTENILKDLSATEQACLDKLETRNMDFGYDKDSGHQKLLDAVNNAIEGLENIKKHSKLDLTKFKQYEKTDKSLENFEKHHFDIESLKSEFETKLPLLHETLMKEASERISKLMDIEQDTDTDDD